jgi:hypothetical protein
MTITTVPGTAPCRPQQNGSDPSKGEDDQINYLKILSAFMKQRT